VGSVFKKVTTKSLPPGAEVVTHKGRRVARWTSRGKTHTAPVNDAGERLVVESRNWYGTVGGKHVPLCRDKQAAEQMLRKLETDAALAGVGLADPFAPHKRTPLATHLADYSRHLTAKGDTRDHVTLTTSRVRALLTGCEFQTTVDLDAGRAAEWLNGLQQPRGTTEVPAGEVFAPRDVARLLGITLAGVRYLVKRHRLPTVGNGRGRKYPRPTVVALTTRAHRGCGPETVNHYVRAVRGFMRWLVRAKRVGANPLDALSLQSGTTDVRRARRELTADELSALLAATAGSPKAYRGLTGADRFHLYLTAATTGFRARALANLTPADFQFAGGTPTVTLTARFNKSRKPKVQPLPPETARQLEPYVAGKPAGRPVWGGTWAADHRGAEMLRGDLEAAGIPYAVEGPDGPAYADFHALRHTYLTLGGRSGIDLRTLQELAGHSKPELTARYSHRRLNDLAGAVGKLPALLPVCTESARTGVRPGPSQATRDLKNETREVVSPTPETTEPPASRGFSPLQSSSVVDYAERGRRDSNPQPPDRQSDTRHQPKSPQPVEKKEDNPPRRPVQLSIIPLLEFSHIQSSRTRLFRQNSVDRDAATAA